jgi:hypothetical protein
MALTVAKNYPKTVGSFSHFHTKPPKGTNHALGENSPNLVTLIANASLRKSPQRYLLRFALGPFERILNSFWNDGDKII